MLLQTDWISLHSGSMNLLRDLEEDVKVAKVLEVGEMSVEEHIGVIIVTSREKSLDIVLF